MYLEKSEATQASLELHTTLHIVAVRKKILLIGGTGEPSSLSMTLNSFFNMLMCS
jgi:hypothetical protein